MELKPFTASDWNAFGGAEPGPLGEPPMLGTLTVFGTGTLARQYDEYIVLVDDSGVSLWTGDADEGDQYTISAFGGEGGYALGYALATLLPSVMSYTALRALGFKDVGDVTLYGDLVQARRAQQEEAEREYGWAPARGNLGKGD